MIRAAEHDRIVVDALRDAGAGVLALDAGMGWIAGRETFARLVDPSEAWPGRTVEATLLDTLLDAETRGLLACPAGDGAERIATALRAYGSDVPIPLADGRMLCADSRPTREGGYAVLVREVAAERFGEDRVVALLRDVLEAAEMGMLRWDASRRVRTVNAAWHDLLGQASVGADILDIGDAMAGRGIDAPDALGTDQVAADARARVRRAVSEAETRPVQRALQCPDGRVVGVYCFPMPSGGALAIASDVTDTISVETRARQLLQDAIEAFEEGMMLYDADGRATLWNGAYERIAFPPDRPPRRGETVREHARLMAETRFWGLPEHLSVEEAADGLVAAVETHVKAFPVTRADGRHIEGSVYPTALGGFLITARDVTERRSAEEEARRMLRDAIEALDEGLILYDADGRVTLWNQAYERIIFPPGRVPRRGETLLEHATMLVDSGHWARPAELGRDQAIAVLLDAAATHAKGFVATMADGRRIEASIYPSPLGGFLTSVRDITDRVAAEEQAREAEARTRTIVESLGEGVALYDADLRMRMNNPAFRRLVMDGLVDLGVGARLVDEIRAVVGAGLIEAPGGDPQPVVDWILDCVANHRTGIELPMADGRTLEASNFAAADGGHLISMRDITERKRAEQAAREADELVRTIVDASPTTFLVSRFRDGKVIYLPQLSRERFGDIETTLGFFLGPEDRERYLAALSETGSLTDYPVRFRRADGSVMDGLTSARIVEHGGERLIVSSTRDVTETLAMQRELARQTELAHQNEKLSALGELLAGVAHELNNPLSIVTGYAAMLADTQLPETAARRVEKLAAAAERCARIVRTFLAMARQRPAVIASCPPRELVATAMEVAGYGLKAAGARIEVDVPPDLPAVAADADQIAQVFANLLTNAEHALEAMGPDGRVRIAARHDTRAGEVAITVADNGPGVPEAARARIFEPFFTTKDVGEGTGVGLAFSHRVIVAHGGSLILTESSDGGASFEMRLPVASTAIAPAASEAASPVRGGPRVLVVDDEPEVAGMLREMLEEEGCEVTTAIRAEDALGLCARRPYDALISDLRMPGMDGEALLAALRRAAPAQAERMGFLTGAAMAAGTEEALARSGRPHLPKPVQPGALMSLVRELAGTA